MSSLNLNATWVIPRLASCATGPRAGARISLSRRPPPPSLTTPPLPLPAVANSTPSTTMMRTTSQRFANLVLISMFSTSTIPWLTLGPAHPLPFHGRRTLLPSSGGARIRPRPRPPQAPFAHCSTVATVIATVKPATCARVPGSRPGCLGPVSATAPEHLCNRVITVGGTMGWVDLWHGMLLCDVHVPSPAEEEESPGPRLLRYVPLPEPMQPDNDLRLHGLSSFFRDVAVLNGRIKFVDLQLHASPGSRTPNGWTAVTWSMAPGDSGFNLERELKSGDMVTPLEPSLFVAHPTLSSHDDDVLYLMTKTSMDDSLSQVIAVNMKNKELERTAKYTTQREACMDFAYTRTAISNFLARDSKGNTKRPGSVLQGSFRKKLPAINPSTHLPTMGDEGDTMDLE